MVSQEIGFSLKCCFMAVLAASEMEACRRLLCLGVHFVQVQLMFWGAIWHQNKWPRYYPRCIVHIIIWCFCLPQNTDDRSPRVQSWGWDMGCVCWVLSEFIMLVGSVSQILSHQFYYNIRADSRFAPSQWETALLCNDVSYWHGASLVPALQYHVILDHLGPQLVTWIIFDTSMAK